jgi:GTPase SAR1 family protein
MYFRDANVALIIFDVTNKRTLDCVDYWSSEIQKANADDYIVVLVGNKSDLTNRR